MSAHVYTLPGHVDRVIDGDSLVCHVGLMPGIELHGVHVRLAGLNAPELRHEGGQAARRFLADLLPPESPVTLISSQEDKYGRLLARIVTEDGRDVSSLMLAAGHGVVMA